MHYDAGNTYIFAVALHGIARSIIELAMRPGTLQLFRSLAPTYKKVLKGYYPQIECFKVSLAGHWKTIKVFDTFGRSQSVCKINFASHKVDSINMETIS